jgi:hypothetical protein
LHSLESAVQVLEKNNGEESCHYCHNQFHIWSLGESE